MKKSYWDGLAENFESRVFNVHEHDRLQIVDSAIHEYGDKNKTIADLGCGVGSFLPGMSKAFKKVIAVDISPKCLQQAEKNCASHSNINYINLDLSSDKINLPRYDMAVSVNSLLTPSLDARLRFIDIGIRYLKKGGYFLLVVPSLESALLVNQRMIELNLNSGIAPQYAQRSALLGADGNNSPKVCIGTVERGGVETKHYLKEEIQIMFEKRKMTMLDCKKIEYHWDTEFFDPPKWMNAPYPWDWYVLAKKN